MTNQWLNNYTGEKMMVKFLPMAASGKINENFTLTKNAHYTASTSIQYIYLGTL